MESLGIAACFTKLPLAGRTKTRLIPALGAEGAARLHESFLGDTIETLLGIQGVDICLFVDGDPEHASLREVRGLGAMVGLRQAEGTLRERLEAAFAYGSAQSEPMVILGSDSPTLPENLIRAAFESLRENDVVLGPASDGGYYLIGARPGLAFSLDGVRWSTHQTYADTVDAVRRASLRVGSLPPWYDIDTPEDLRLLRLHLRLDPRIAPRTALHFDQGTSSH